MAAVGISGKIVLVLVALFCITAGTGERTYRRGASETPLTRVSLSRPHLSHPPPSMLWIRFASTFWKGGRHEMAHLPETLTLPYFSNQNWNFFLKQLLLILLTLPSALLSVAKKLTYIFIESMTNQSNRVYKSRNNSVSSVCVNRLGFRFASEKQMTFCPLPPTHTSATNRRLQNDFWDNSLIALLSIRSRKNRGIYSVSYDYTLQRQ